MNTSLEQRLTETLDRRADGVDRASGARPIRLDDVRSRATSIRRHRRVANAVAVAAAAALIVPVGVIGVSGLDRSEDNPPVAELVPDPVEEPVELTTDVEEGPTPQVTWMEDSEVHLPDGTTFTVEADYFHVQLIAGRAMARANDPDTGIDRLDELGPDGEVLSSTTIGDELVITDDHSAAAWLDRQGRLHLLTEQGVRDTGVQLPQSSLSVLEGGDGCAADCAVWWYGHGNRGGPGRTDIDNGRSEDVADHGNVLDVHQNGLLTGVTSVDEMEPGSCSTVREDGAPVWETCDHTVERFSPDGSWVMASDPYQDGIGQSTLTVLDARTGERQVTYEAGDGFLTSRLWEDESHLLVLHYSYEQQSWQVLRVGLDGSVELAGPPREDQEDYESPYRLPG